MNALPLAAHVARITHTSSGLGVWPAIGFGVLVFCVGIAVGATLLRLRSKARPRPPATTDPEATPGMVDAASTATSSSPGQIVDGPALVGALIELADQVPGARGQSTVTTALSACGIVPDRPVGSLFDATRHHVVDTDTTNDPEQDMVIAEVERPGYLRRDECLRPADVVVLRYQAQSDARPA